ncbi:MAG: hypothetical protein LC667_05090, partial [Thioalkalivibrio sp.]|nr:hypothetical protein [Thioalkalivibrio sp.]
VRMGWRDAGEGEPVTARSFAVGIPADLRPGDYTLELTVSARGRGASVARRAVTVVAGGRTAGNRE